VKKKKKNFSEDVVEWDIQLIMDKTSSFGLFESVGGFESRLPAEGRMCPKKKMKKK
jgi:hypothetical protein